MATVNERVSGKIARQCKGSYCDSPNQPATNSAHIIIYIFENAPARRQACDAPKTGYSARPARVKRPIRGGRRELNGRLREADRDAALAGAERSGKQFTG